MAGLWRSLSGALQDLGGGLGWTLGGGPCQARSPHRALCSRGPGRVVLWRVESLKPIEGQQRRGLSRVHTRLDWKSTQAFMAGLWVGPSRPGYSSRAAPPWPLAFPCPGRRPIPIFHICAETSAFWPAGGWGFSSTHILLSGQVEPICLQCHPLGPRSRHVVWGGAPATQLWPLLDWAGSVSSSAPELPEKASQPQQLPLLRPQVLDLGLSPPSSVPARRVLAGLSPLGSHMLKGPWGPGHGAPWESSPLGW